MRAGRVLQPLATTLHLAHHAPPATHPAAPYCTAYCTANSTSTGPCWTTAPSASTSIGALSRGASLGAGAAAARRVGWDVWPRRSCGVVLPLLLAWPSRPSHSLPVEPTPGPPQPACSKPPAGLPHPTCPLTPPSIYPPPPPPPPPHCTAQVRDEYRMDYDSGRGGYGSILHKEMEVRARGGRAGRCSAACGAGQDGRRVQGQGGCGPGRQPQPLTVPPCPSRRALDSSTTGAPDADEHNGGRNEHGRHWRLLGAWRRPPRGRGHGRRGRPAAALPRGGRPVAAGGAARAPRPPARLPTVNPCLLRRSCLDLCPALFAVLLTAPAPLSTAIPLPN